MLGRLRIGLIASVIALGCVSCGSPGPGGSARQEVPEDREAALVRIKARYGDVSSVYGEASVDRSEWHRLEPGLASGVELTDANRDDPIYALFVEGTFSIPFPPSVEEQREGDATFVAGRFVIDGGSGEFLSVALWPQVRQADRGFGAEFDDS